MILALDTASGKVEVGGNTLPGIVQKITVFGELEYENVQQDNSSKTVKTLKGFKDAAITIDLSIVDPEDSAMPGLGKTRYDELKKLNNIFRCTKDGSPVVYWIGNPHLRARNISYVVFSGLQSTEEDWGIVCSLTFVEHEKKIEKTQDKQAKNASTASASTTKATPPQPSAQELAKQRALERRFQK